MIWQIIVVLLLVGANGFFVAAEFALVKVRRARLGELAAQGRPGTRAARWLVERLDSSLSACQLGITMASLGLGWVGEPAFARLLAPLFEALGVTSPVTIHTIAFLVAFTAITALHLVVGEQAPKIFAIRRPEAMLLWCALPLRIFYVLFYPLLAALTAVTGFLLRRAGVTGAEHETPFSEAEIRTLVSDAYARGELSRAEHRLVHAVFEFDDLICRRVMVPRADVVGFEVDQPLADCIAEARRTLHTRYPVYEGDDVVGIVHIKDLIGLSGSEPFDLRMVLRPARRVPESLPISKLLRHFQTTRDHMALVADEYDNLIGFVTLENVLEQIVGPVEDEFDAEVPEIQPEGEGRFVVAGSAGVDRVARRLGVDLGTGDVDTVSGLVIARAGRMVQAGDRVDLGAATAEVLEVKGARVTRLRLEVRREVGEGERS
jgi:CBS domain containing-hemolysin-like protein